MSHERGTPLTCMGMRTSEVTTASATSSSACCPAMVVASCRAAGRLQRGEHVSHVECSFIC